jgi:general secretion pathway protein H
MTGSGDNSPHLSSPRRRGEGPGSRAHPRTPRSPDRTPRSPDPLISRWTTLLGPLSLSAGRGKGRGQSAFTLLEMMIVLALVALLTGSVVIGFRAFAKSELRGSSAKLAGAIRYLFDRASSTGKIHRLVLDFDESKYWAEASDDRFFAPRERETDESREKEAEAEVELAQARAEGRVDENGEEISGDEAQIDPSRYQPTEWKPKKARFEKFAEKSLKTVELKGGIKLAGLFTARYARPIATGKGYLYFFPLGQTEPAVVHISDEEGQTFYSLLVHPLNGRVQITAGYVEPRVDEQFDDEGVRIERAESR